LTFDLVIKGGHVVDPAQGLDGPLDIGISRGRIVAIQKELEQSQGGPTTRLVDATGAFVVPGLIDIHAHVYAGVCPLTVAADEMCSQTGVTTIVSAGDAGANTIEGFRQLIVNGSRTRVLAFVHISTIGLACFPVGESVQIGLLDMAAAESAIARFPDMIVGLKVRQGGSGVTGDNGLEPLKRAISVGRSVGLPVMVHITDSDKPIIELLAMLGAGDIVTHCFTGSANGLRQDGHIVDAAQGARDRGVVFDVGHGAGSFDFDVAEAAGHMGFWPDTISTDLHSISAPKAKSLPDVMAKMLAIGMPFNDVIAAVTNRAAKAIGRADKLGSLRTGSVADVAVLDRRHGSTVFSDTFGHDRTGQETLTARHTIRAGTIWGSPAHPATGVAVIAD
jgi:dihydroorotase